MQKNEIVLLLQHSQKLTQNGSDLYVKSEMLKLLEENMGKISSALVLAMIFFDMTPKAQATKAKINR